MSTSDLDLDEMDYAEEVTFPPAERRIVTQAYDLSIQTLIEQWEAGILLVPEYQREWVWDKGRASRLVESLILNIPIPVLYFAETEEAKYEIVDGQQRVRSILDFANNEFALGGLAVLGEYNKLRFHQLPEREQRFLKTRMIRTVVISHESHPTIKFEIFERLNSGSVALNAQELRNVVYRGRFNQLLRQLSLHPLLREILGTKHPRPRMIDEELVLRFFTLSEWLDKYRPPLKRMMNDYMRTKSRINEDELKGLADRFDQALTRVHAVFGPEAFRLTDAQGKRVEKQINRALFEAQVLGLSWVENSEELLENRGAILKEFAELYQTSEFLDSIQRATGDRTRFKLRLREAVNALGRSGVSVRMPQAIALE